MRAFHEHWVVVAVASNGLVGAWGLWLAWRRAAPGRPFATARGVAILAMLVQVGAGFWLVAGGAEPPDIHTFYGFLILFSLTFGYIYRAQLARWPGLGYGLLLLWVMGLGLQAWSNAT